MYVRARAETCTKNWIRDTVGAQIRDTEHYTGTAFAQIFVYSGMKFWVSLKKSGKNFQLLAKIVIFFLESWENP